MRGTLLYVRLVLSLMGIIPAHAGNTYDHVFQYFFHWDHPRTCGEHACGSMARRFSAGSSPHMRGTHPLSSLPKALPRIIPAHAGNTPYAPPCDCGAWDHPRTCGEHALPSTAKPLNRGSSPHMRGTLAARVLVHCHVGIIPAHAGNTAVLPCGVGR